MHDDAARRCSLLRNIVVEREEPGEFVKVFRRIFADASFFGFTLLSLVFLVVLLLRGRSALEIVRWRSK
jgi:hypothetical protein